MASVSTICFDIKKIRIFGCRMVVFDCVVLKKTICFDISKTRIFGCRMVVFDCVVFKKKPFASTLKKLEFLVAELLYLICGFKKNHLLRHLKN